MKKKYLKYIVGILMLLSFAIYLLIPMIFTSDISGCTKTTLFIMLNILSWGMFFVATVLGGKEIFNKIKR